MVSTIRQLVVRARPYRARRSARPAVAHPIHSAPGVAPAAEASSAHLHEWRVVADECDDFGPVRSLTCAGCGDMRYE